MTEKKSSKVSILIVEDEQASLLMLENMLKKGGYSIAGTAGSGDEAVRLADRPGGPTPDAALYRGLPRIDRPGFPGIAR